METYPESNLPDPTINFNFQNVSKLKRTSLQGTAKKQDVIPGSQRLVVSATWVMTNTQRSIFQNWFEIKISKGNAWFNMNLVLFEGQRSMTPTRFVGAAYEAQYSEGHWNITASLEIENPLYGFTLSELEAELTQRGDGLGLEWPELTLGGPNIVFGLTKVGNNVLRTEMKSGRFRQRLIDSDAEWNYSVSFIWTIDQLTIFAAWFKYKTNFGAEFFSMLNHHLQLAPQTIDVRMINGEWEVTHIEGMFSVSFALETFGGNYYSEGALDTLMNPNE